MRTFTQRVDPPVRAQVAGNREGLASHPQGPGHLLVFEVRGHPHDERAPVTTLLEARRLILPKDRRLEHVIGAEWNLENLVRIPVEIAEREAVRPIVILIPTLVSRRDGPPGRAVRGQRYLCQSCDRADRQQREPESRTASDSSSFSH